MLKFLQRFALPLSLVLSSGLHAETMLKLNETAGSSSLEAAALKDFKANVERATAGGVRIELHFGGSLGDPYESVENMMSGDLDLFSSDLRFYTPLMIDEITGLDLPFMVTSNKAARRYMDSPLFNEGRDKVLHLRRVRFLELDAFRGPHRIMASMRPVSSLDDLKGMKLAVFPSPSKADATLWSALGASLVDVPWSGVGAALGDHRLDGVVSPDLSTLIAAGVTKIAPYLGPLRDHSQVWQISISEAAWEKLNPAEQADVAKAARQTADKYNDLAERLYRSESSGLRALKPIKVDALSAHQRLTPTYDKLVAAGATTERVKNTAGSVDGPSPAR